NAELCVEPELVIYNSRPQ
ncbi:hypothetical protein A2U01_0063871, partial [Trifolium medium]|nr:hypothetical protein [Trifolium medium]